LRRFCENLDLSPFCASRNLLFRICERRPPGEGWDFDDTTGKGAKGPLPPEAGEVESIVGQFFVEQASGARWSAEELCESLSRKVTEDELTRVRRRRSEFFTEWRAVEPGSVLNLKFPS
jgi:hypothetical protein